MCIRDSPRSEAREEALPVRDLAHPVGQPLLEALHGAALLVVAVEEVVVPAVTALHRRGEGAERLVHHRRDLELRSEHQARVAQDALTRPDLLLSLIHISEPTRLLSISYAVFC